MSAINELMSNIHWMIYDLVDGDQIDNEEEKRLEELRGKSAKELERLQRIEAVAEDVNEWLKRNGLKDTAHQRLLETALKGE